MDEKELTKLKALIYAMINIAINNGPNNMEWELQNDLENAEKDLINH